MSKVLIPELVLAPYRYAYLVVQRMRVLAVGLSMADFIPDLLTLGILLREWYSFVVRTPEKLSTCPQDISNLKLCTHTSDIPVGV